MTHNVRPPAAVALERTEFSLPKINNVREITISGYRKPAIAAGGGWASCIDYLQRQLF